MELSVVRYVLNNFWIKCYVARGDTDVFLFVCLFVCFISWVRFTISHVPVTISNARLTVSRAQDEILIQAHFDVIKQCSRLNAGYHLKMEKLPENVFSLKRN